eukprot:2356283-Amphidinium_carterae.1
MTKWSNTSAVAASQLPQPVATDKNGGTPTHHLKPSQRDMVTQGEAPPMTGPPRQSITSPSPPPAALKGSSPAVKPGGCPKGDSTGAKGKVIPSPHLKGKGSGSRNATVSPNPPGKWKSGGAGLGFPTP